MDKITHATPPLEILIFHFFSQFPYVFYWNFGSGCDLFQLHTAVQKVQQQLAAFVFTLSILLIKWTS